MQIKIIQKLCNIFLNVQQLVIQLDVYLVLSLPLYHSFRTFQFINIFPFEVCAFVLKLHYNVFIDDKQIQ